MARTLSILFIAEWALWKQAGPSRRVAGVIGLLVAVVAGGVVLLLGSRSTWPDWLADGGSLSDARHTLWSDVLSLWATNPLVGAELGAIGVVLLGVLLAGGLLFVARGSRPMALIAMAAWTALAAHSAIDHIEDFPIVALMGGVVLGWSGYGTRSFAGSRVLGTRTPEVDV